MAHSVYDTPARKLALLSAAAEAPSYRKACEAAGVAYSVGQLWKREDEEFAEALAAAEDERRDRLREHAYERAVAGYERPIVYKGEPIWKRDPHTNEILLDDDFNPIPLTERVVSDRILERYLEANVPEYAKKSSVELSGPGGGPIAAKVIVNFVDPPDWDNVEWDEETGRAKLADPLED